jgi:uncharacterized membrane protein
MTARQALTAGALLTAAALVYAWVLYPALPAQIPIHWNLRGEVDGWGDKAWAIYLMPGTMALFMAMIPGLPWLSPRAFSVDRFRGTFHYVMLLLIAMMGYLHVVMLQAALHPGWESGRALIAGLLGFMALLGNVLGKVRRNFWIGVRTPWTLASDRVWTATHRLAARLLVAAGLLGAILVLVGVHPAICFGLLLAALLVPAGYSLVLYKRLEAEGEL